MENNNNSVNMNKENNNNTQKSGFNVKSFGIGIAVGAGTVLIGRAIKDWNTGRKARKAKQEEIETPVPTEQSK